ncbi:MAG TPA: hypothetical protein VD866_10210, partial [Urbifossiella sp.]|nr:hypothetical protein [Urbifossiella sp.]
TPNFAAFNPSNVRPTVFAVLGEGLGGGWVRVFDFGAGNERFRFRPFGDFTGGIRTASADVSGDGIPDIITGTGIGGGPVVKVFDGATFAQISSFYAYEPSFRGGVTVTAGDITGTGVASIITGSGFGGGPVVRVFDALGNVQRSFFAYDQSQRGGVNVGVGNLNPTGPASIITGAGRGGAPHVKTFDGRTGAQVLSFFAYDTSFSGGVYVTGGRLSGAGSGVILTATGDGGGPLLRSFDGVTGALRNSFSAFGPDAYGRTLREGFTVNLSHIGGADGESRIILGSGPKYGPTVRVLDGDTLQLLNEFIPYEDGFDGGVFVG